MVVDRHLGEHLVPNLMREGASEKKGMQILGTDLKEEANVGHREATTGEMINRPTSIMEGKP